MGGSGLLSIEGRAYPERVCTAVVAEDGDEDGIGDDRVGSDDEDFLDEYSEDDKDWEDDEDEDEDEEDDEDFLDELGE